MSETRKLAAILVADVVGYSRLAGADEDRTLARLRGLRSDLIDPAIAAHHGRIVKRTGDGSIIEFRSVVDAVRCAIEVQNGMVERNAGLPPERRIEFRVGIHLGDVVEESDGDLMGDGVNIAARLESICEPGAICLSEDAYRQVSGRLDMEVSDLGQTQLKNIERPIRVYSLRVGVPAQAKPPAPKKRPTLATLAAGIAALLILIAAGAWWFLNANRPATVVNNAPAPVASKTAAPAEAPRFSIVVLPFTNLSGDPGQDYLADVITEGLTTDVSRIGFFVIARSTAFTYKGKPVDVRQVGKDLGVRYALEGSAQREGTRVRVNAQLVDAETGAHLWADQFDADRADLLQMQDEIVTRLARAMQIQLVAVDAARVTRTRPGNLDAEDLALRCSAGLYNSPPGSAELTAAFDLCDRALQIDNSNVVALTVMTERYINPVVGAQSRDPQADIRRADELVSRALAIDPNFFAAHFEKAWVLMAQGRTQEAVSEGERSLALNPSFIPAYVALCAANNFLGRPDRALELADKAIRLSPRDPGLRDLYHQRGWALFEKRLYDQAIEWLQRAEGVSPFTEWLLASAFALTGRQADAEASLKRFKNAYPGIATMTIAQLRAHQLAAADNEAWLEYNERLFEGLRKAGMPEE
jgi:adenylate cyclase